MGHANAKKEKEKRFEIQVLVKFGSLTKLLVSTKQKQITKKWQGFPDIFIPVTTVCAPGIVAN